MGAGWRAVSVGFMQTIFFHENGILMGSPKIGLSAKKKRDDIWDNVNSGSNIEDNNVQPLGVELAREDLKLMEEPSVAVDTG
jgi:hypothetical protein